MASPRQSIQLMCLHEGTACTEEQIIAALHHADIHCIEKTEPARHLSSVITFNQATDPDALRQRIRQAKLQQGAHVIVLNLQPAALDLHQTWDLLCCGAQDVLNWSSLPETIRALQARLERWQQVDRLLESRKVKEHLIGQSTAWRLVLQEIVEAAAFSQAPILILGESGTGKELVARMIHELDLRPYKQELVLLDCSSIAPELSGSEFFGHEKGSFTSAMSTRDGAFHLADKGTLFLDEIGELPLRLQAELLRVIQEGTYKRVGSNTWQRTNFRLVCATNRDLWQEVEERRFREDLYYRLSTWVFRLPPLRERREDIPELVRFFLQKNFSGKPLPPIDPLLMHYLETREYPGNIRELGQIVTRIATRHVGSGPINLSDIAESDRHRAGFEEDPWYNPGFLNTLQLALKHGLGLKEIVNEVSNTTKDLAIRDAGGNLQLAARRLNITDRTLQSFQAVKRERPTGSG
ncbi:MAG: sigma-54-dependent Fis family transcriptional regulator [Saprospiraceae bacterium]|nr:sigma-54-dependent Fis family transcriptional regulator [Saprospiraceae bacterium]